MRRTPTVSATLPEEDFASSVPVSATAPESVSCVPDGKDHPGQVEMIFPTAHRLPEVTCAYIQADVPLHSYHSRAIRVQSCRPCAQLR